VPVKLLPRSDKFHSPPKDDAHSGLNCPVSALKLASKFCSELAPLNAGSVPVNLLLLTRKSTKLGGRVAGSGPVSELC
jgi:hypothetical protein